jgi:HTH-type transcriptional regulator / antitoxin HipB
MKLSEFSGMGAETCYYEDMPINDEFRIYNAQALGQAVRHFREEAGLTQAELGERVGLHQSYISEIESGKVTEHTRRLIALLKVLGVRLTVGRADW